MTNYSCSSHCRHCAYFSGPRWPNHYIDEDTTRRVMDRLRDWRCRSIHIGGGEPFLDRDGICDVVTWCAEERIGIEYVETNASWYGGGERDNALLERLRRLGLSTLLVSISPFHNEYVPWRKTRGLIDACGSRGISVFPWVEGFIPDIESFPPDSTHTLDEYESRYGDGYLQELPSRYWISMRGRSVATFGQFLRRRAAAEIAESSGGCRELFDTSHFHVDLYGNYVPGVCSGLAVSIEDAGGILDEERYPHLSLLMVEGIGGLLRHAESRYGFVPERKYGGKCDLCYDIRRYLVIEAGCDAGDLEPRELYRQMTYQGAT